jgi:hypothetical protein
MSRFLTVCAVVGNAVVTAQVGDAVRLVASRLAGSAWWNDREHDRRQSLARLHLDWWAQARTASKE